MRHETERKLKKWVFGIVLALVALGVICAMVMLVVNG
jgi:hypothetical protein